MSHYDCMYDNLEVEEIDERVKKMTNTIKVKTNHKESIRVDLQIVKNDYTIKVLNDEISEIDIKLNDYNKELNAWNNIKERINCGEKINKRYAYDIVSNFKN